MHTDRRCDIGMIGYEMTLLATSVGHALSPGVRTAPMNTRPSNAGPVRAGLW